MDVFPPSMQREALLEFAEALDCVSTALRAPEGVAKAIDVVEIEERARLWTAV
jgi:hypothetical protein